MSWEPGKSLEMMEREAIIQAVRFYDGSKSIAAQVLGISVKTIYNKLKLYGEKIDGREFQEATGEIQTSPEVGVQTKDRLHVESSFEVPEKQPMPMQQREEVQTLSSKRAVGNHTHRRR